MAVAARHRHADKRQFALNAISGDPRGDHVDVDERERGALVSRFFTPGLPTFISECG